MEDTEIKIIQTIAVVIILLILQVLTRKAINNALKRLHVKRQNRKIMVKILNLFSVIIAVIFIISIWGIDPSKLGIFLSTILTVIGVAFFANWSILSNITASVLLFFTHPLKIGDKIRIIDKDNPVTGIVEDITFFFMHITTDSKQKITIPNNIILQKVISIENDSLAS